MDRSYIKYTPCAIKEGFHKLRRLINFKTEKETYTNIISNYTGGKKRVYMRSYYNLVNNGFQKKHTYVKMFIKADRFPEADINNKAPRAIQYRSCEFNLQMARYLRRFEEKCYSDIKHRGRRVIAKGLNYRQRAELLMDKISDFTNPWYINLDHKKFDSTVNKEHLKQLHTLYKRGTHKSIYNLLKYQLRNKCFTKHHIKYNSEATRCSGDYDTGLGNTLINIACILYVFNGKFDFILDGDDAVIITEGKPKFEFDCFEKFGFETEITITKDKHMIEFCQSRLIYNKGWLFSRNPLRALSNNMVCRIGYNLKGMRRYMKGVGMCEFACSAGVPILHYQARRLMFEPLTALIGHDQRWKMLNLAHGEELEVTPMARITFSKSWGISIGMQLAIESSLLPLMSLTAYSGYTERIQNAKQLYKSWTRMATMGDPSSPSWCWFGECRAASVFT